MSDSAVIAYIHICTRDDLHNRCKIKPGYALCNGIYFFSSFLIKPLLFCWSEKKYDLQIFFAQYFGKEAEIFQVPALVPAAASGMNYDDPAVSIYSVGPQ